MKLIVCLLTLALVGTLTHANVLSNIADQAREDFQHIKEAGQNLAHQVSSKFQQGLDDVKSLANQITTMVGQGKSPSEIIQFFLKPHPELLNALTHLKNVAQAVQAGQTVQQIVQSEVATFPEVKDKVDAVCGNQYFTTVPFIKNSCNFLTAHAPVVARIRRDIFGDLKAKFQNELDHLKQLADSLTHGKNPLQAARELVQSGLHKLLAKVCKISILRKIDFVKKSCPVVEQAQQVDPAPVPEPAVDPAPVPVEQPAQAPAAPAQRKHHGKPHKPYQPYFPEDPLDILDEGEVHILPFPFPDQDQGQVDPVLAAPGPVIVPDLPAPEPAAPPALAPAA